MRSAREIQRRQPADEAGDEQSGPGRATTTRVNGMATEAKAKRAVWSSTRWTSSSSSRSSAAARWGYTITNVTLWMALAVAGVVALLVLGTSRAARRCPGGCSRSAELAYGFVYKMVEDVAGKDGCKYFPYIMTLFMFIVFANFLGLLPTAFTTTSHIAVTASMALMVFLTVTVLGFVKHGPGSWACSGSRRRRCRCARCWR